MQSPNPSGMVPAPGNKLHLGHVQTEHLMDSLPTPATDRYLWQIFQPSRPGNVRKAYYPEHWNPQMSGVREVYYPDHWNPWMPFLGEL